MSNITYAIAERREEEQREQDLFNLELNFKLWLSVAGTSPTELDFWQWFAKNKDKIARNRALIDLIG